ncbi:hypothetical protein IV203_008673 [Nitzschia inconspicua]|uniref:PD-(D/E)XK endonuclease-like domain-containing protein n=1 Tax=Nitzschia inconspicua TaxID=303405 RepID=A0A9K3KYZ0_9STRA|nr:hypothetical protein IV203_008673 [Nitzschia inconspicua]
MRFSFREVALLNEIRPSTIRDSHVKTVTELVDLYFPYVRPTDKTQLSPFNPFNPSQRNLSERLTPWEARKKGLELHKAIECYFNGEFTKISYDKTSKEWKQFLAFLDNERILSFQAEMTLESTEHMMRGRADLVTHEPFEKFGMIDFKRSDRISNEYDNDYGHYPTGMLSDFNLKNNEYTRNTLKLNLYRAMLEREGHSVESMRIVYFHPNLENYKVVEIKRMEAVTNAILEDQMRVFNAELMERWNKFLSSLLEEH